MKIALFLIAASVMWAQVQRPQIGVMLANDGSARPLTGVAGSIAVGSAIANDVIAMGCSAQLCLMKMASSIVSPTGVVDAPAGSAMFWFSGDSALVYFPAAKRLARWHGDQLDPLSFEITGEILSIRQAIDGSIQFAVRVGRQIWIEGQGGAMIQSLPGAIGPVILLGNGALFVTRDGIVLRRDDATELSFVIGQVQSMSWLGGNYVQASHHGIRVDAGHEGIFLLPGSR